MKHRSFLLAIVTLLLFSCSKTSIAPTPSESPSITESQIHEGHSHSHDDESEHSHETTEDSPVHVHHWSQTQVLTEPTCTEPGEARYTCTECGESKTEQVPALNHEFRVSWTVDVEPSCVSDGEKSRHCKRCDARTDVTVVPKTDHRYGDPETLKEATCTEPGKVRYVCLDCGDVHEVETPALKHEFRVSWTVDVEPSCVSDGEKSRHCKRCDARTDVTVIPKTGHHYGDPETISEPTCVEPGKQRAVCTDCGDVHETEIAPLGHAYATSWTIDVPASCVSDGQKSHHCTRCDAKTDVTVIPKTDHRYGNPETLVEATCTEKGKLRYVCLDCGHVYETTAPALGHSYETTWTVDHEATCYDAGEKSHHCTRCNARKDITEIPALEHEDEWLYVPASAHSYGARIHRCPVCNKVISRKTYDEIRIMSHSVTKGIKAESGLGMVYYCNVSIHLEGATSHKKSWGLYYTSDPDNILLTGETTAATIEILSRTNIVYSLYSLKIDVTTDAGHTGSFTFDIGKEKFSEITQADRSFDVYCNDKISYEGQYLENLNYQDKGGETWDEKIGRVTSFKKGTALRIEGKDIDSVTADPREDNLLDESLCLTEDAMRCTLLIKYFAAQRRITVAVVAKCPFEEDNELGHVLKSAPDHTIISGSMKTGWTLTPLTQNGEGEWKAIQFYMVHGYEFVIKMGDGDYRGYSDLKLSEFALSIYERASNARDNIYSPDFSTADLYVKDVPDQDGTYVGKSIWVEQHITPRIRVTFRVHYVINTWGQSIYYMCANSKWEARSEYRMVKDADNYWSITVENYAGVNYIYKYAVANDSTGEIIRWEGGTNRFYSSMEDTTVTDTWQA